MVWASLGRSSSCKLLDIERCLEDIVLTSGYAEDLENAPVEVWGQRGRRQGGGADLGLQSWLSPQVDCGMNYKHQ